MPIAQSRCTDVERPDVRKRQNSVQEALAHMDLGDLVPFDIIVCIHAAYLPCSLCKKALGCSTEALNIILRCHRY